MNDFLCNVLSFINSNLFFSMEIEQRTHEISTLKHKKYHKVDKHGDTDDRCTFCKKMCARKSSITNRYFAMQCGKSDNERKIYMFYACDKCMDKNDVNDGDTLKYKQKKYKVDGCFRMND